MLPPWMYRVKGPGIWDPDIELYLACLEADAAYHEAQRKMTDDARRRRDDWWQWYERHARVDTIGAGIL